MDRRAGAVLLALLLLLLLALACRLMTEALAVMLQQRVAALRVARCRDRHGRRGVNHVWPVHSHSQPVMY